MTEEQIRASQIGEATVLSGGVHIANYDPEWPMLYEREAERIRSALGNRIVLLEHVGSTSVPGLAAKPKIDILLIVPDSADENEYVPALEAAGYKLTVREHPPGGGAPFVQDSLIQQIDFTVDKDPASTKVVYSLLQANPTSYLILDDVTSGTLDSTNTLGY